MEPVVAFPTECPVALTLFNMMKTRNLLSLAGLALALLLPVSLSAETLQLSVILTPDGATQATGQGTMTIDPSTQNYVLALNIVGLEQGDLASAGLYVGPTDGTGVKVDDLDTTSFEGDANLLVGVFSKTLPAEYLGDLFSGMVTVSIQIQGTGEPIPGISGSLELDSQAQSQLLNFSCRGMINPGNGKAGILIGGFVIGEPGQTVLMRCIGDGLTKWGLKSLKDTEFTVYDFDGNIVASNDDWKESGQEFAIIATGFAPDRDSDAALIKTFEAGAYTVHADSNKGAGIALVDMYGVSSKTVRGVIDTAASGMDTKEFTILNLLLDGTELETILDGPGPFTLFAPTDAAFEQLAADTLEALIDDETILRYHVVAAEWDAAHLPNGNLTTIQGSDLTIDGMMVNDATIIEVDLGASNGIIHVIDRVLDPEDAP